MLKPVVQSRSTAGVGAKKLMRVETVAENQHSKAVKLENKMQEVISIGQ